MGATQSEQEGRGGVGQRGEGGGLEGEGRKVEVGRDMT